jgi:hypothetical protein
MKRYIAITILALVAGVSSTSAQSLVFSDNFDDNILSGWATYGYPGILIETNHLLVITENTYGPLQPYNPGATHTPAGHGLPASGALLDQETLELRADLVSANQKDAFAGLGFVWLNPDGKGYMFTKDEDELTLCKLYNNASSFAWFFDTNQPIKNQNVTLVLALTRVGSSVNINTRVLDKDNANAVLFDRTTTDTPSSDDVLLNPPYGKIPGSADPAGTPWPVSTWPTHVELTLTWANPERAPQPRAQVIYDNLEIWRYQTPTLGIQNAVVLSWPVTAPQFVLESAPGGQGPWEVVSAPWSRTNATQIEVSVPAPDSMRLFRLKFAP